MTGRSASLPIHSIISTQLLEILSQRGWAKLQNSCQVIISRFQSDMIFRRGSQALVKQMKSNKKQPFSRISKAAILSLSGFLASGAALAKDPLEAAQDLAGTTQTDPNGFTLMIVSICMLFVFALTLIIAASMHVFKKKPARKPGTSTQKDLSYTSSTTQH